MKDSKRMGDLERKRKSGEVRSGSKKASTKKVS